MKKEKRWLICTERISLKMLDFSAEEIEYLIDLAAELKEKKKKGIPPTTFCGKKYRLDL